MMMRFTLSLAASILVAHTARAATAEEIRGEQLVHANCGRCHAMRPGEASPHPQAPSFRHLAQRFPLDDLAEGLAEGLVTGHPDMPEFVFTAGDAEDIIVYLKSIQDQ